MTWAVLSSGLSVFIHGRVNTYSTWRGERAWVSLRSVASKGGSTFLLACATPKVPIYSIDCAPQDDERLQQIFKETGQGRRVNLIVGDSQHGRFPSVGPYDVLFIDGDHSYDGVAADISNWYGGLAKNGHMLFHDSHKRGVQDAIADFITAHPEAQVLLTPFMGPSYWENPHGSLAHLIKR
jgi:predicted O-methyltransferase YrrM